MLRNQSNESLASYISHAGSDQSDAVNQPYLCPQPPSSALKFQARPQNLKRINLSGRQEIFAEWIRTEQNFIGGLSSEELKALHEHILMSFITSDPVNLCKAMLDLLPTIQQSYERYIWSKGTCYLKQDAPKLTLNPLGRIMTYTILTERLAKQTPVEHPDHQSAHLLNLKMRALVVDLDKLVGDVKFLVKFPDLVTFVGAVSYDGSKHLKATFMGAKAASQFRSGSNYTISLFREDGDRQFIRHDTVTSYVYNKGFKCLNKPAELFLFSDLLCVGTRNKKFVVGSTEKPWRLHHEPVPLRDVVIKLLPPVQYASVSKDQFDVDEHVVELKVGCYCYHFGFDSLQNRGEWARLVAKLKEENVQSFVQGNTGVDAFDSMGGLNRRKSLLDRIKPWSAGEYKKNRTLTSQSSLSSISVSVSGFFSRSLSRSSSRRSSGESAELAPQPPTDRKIGFLRSQVPPRTNSLPGYESTADQLSTVENTQYQLQK